ncbi:hypothetical protein J45TS6_34730 [Paenibacillus sp. J45TS6]|uniref:hypothetical protein n=1 Tax=Paenibacillus sp. J45TS6 TaxID=2807196 RepID=UPI001B0F3A92|nr:hypothetical protein [Paenibacillus sp. J45TS6]GIP45014.1 hypothetical protein J45TS6_34730 [Paenibacillus sp. J45TS6]
MRCGAKRYVVITEAGGQTKETIVKARTAIEARKVIRKQYGPSVPIQNVYVLPEEQVQEGTMLS